VMDAIKKGSITDVTAKTMRPDATTKEGMDQIMSMLVGFDGVVRQNSKYMSPMKDGHVPLMVLSTQTGGARSFTSYDDDKGLNFSGYMAFNPDQMGADYKTDPDKYNNRFMGAVAHELHFAFEDSKFASAALDKTKNTSDLLLQEGINEFLASNWTRDYNDTDFESKYGTEKWILGMVSSLNRDNGNLNDLTVTDNDLSLDPTTSPTFEKGIDLLNRAWFGGDADAIEKVMRVYDLLVEKGAPTGQAKSTTVE